MDELDTRQTSSVRFYVLIIVLIAFSSVRAQDLEQDLSPYEEALTTNRNQGCPFDIGPEPISPTCNGFNDGQACVNIGNPAECPSGFQFIWVGSSDTDNCLENVSAGTYTAIVICPDDGTSCGVDIMVTEPAPLTVFNMQAVPPSCNGACDGQANPIVIGGTGSKEYSYDSGENTQMADELCNPFQLTVTDDNGCFIDTTYDFLDEPLPIVIDASIDSLDCAGASNAAIDITVSEGTPDYDYEWTGPNGFSTDVEDISGLEAGTYDLLVTDDNGCEQTASYIIEAPDPISISAVIQDVECFGQNTGAIEIDVSGGQPDYVFAWIGPNGYTSGDEDINSLAAGTYSLSIIDDLGCPFDTTFMIQEDDQLMITAVVSDETCFGFSDGAIEVSFSIDCSACLYAWTGPNGFTSTDEDIDDLEPGDYELTVTYNVNCTEDTLFTVLGPDEIQIDVMPFDPTCFGGNDGSIEVEVTGGVPDYTFNWTGPGGFTSPDEDISGLLAGNYSLEVTDDSGCVMMTDTLLSEPSEIMVSDSIVPIECAGDGTGEIYIEVSGGNPDYDFEWTGPNGYTSTDEDITGLFLGTYTLTITDQQSCDTILQFLVDETPALQFDNVTVTDLLCREVANGEIDIEVSGGTLDYVFDWTGPNGFISSDEDIVDLEPGDYTVVIVDANDCILDSLVSVSSPDSLVVVADTTHISCFGADDGAIDLMISGGTLDYDVTWTGPNGFTSDQEDISSLEPGIYDAEVIDGNGCSVASQVEVFEPIPIEVDTVITDVFCSGDSTGAIDLIVSGGIAPYDFLWTGPDGYTSDQEDIIDVPAGDYTVTITDNATCDTSLTFTILELDPIIFDLEDVSDLLCLVDMNGAIEIEVSGGQPDYTYEWIGPNGFTSDQEDLSGLGPGSYELTVTDVNDCTVEALYEVLSPDSLLATVDSTDISCFGADDGMIDLQITGGTLDYTITWTGPDGFSTNDEDITDLAPGLYEAQIIDANDCVLEISVTIEEPDEFDVIATVTDVDCAMDSTGSIELDISGAMPPYIFNWTGPNGYTSGDEDIFNLIEGDYTVMISDMSLCDTTLEFTISEPDPIEIDSLILGHLACYNDSSGSISTVVSGGSGPLDFEWSGPNGFLSMDQDISGLIAGDYGLLVTDTNGCSLDTLVQIIQPDSLVATLSGTDLSCFGSMDGSFELEVSGGTPDYTIDWSGPNGYISDQEDIVDLEAGTYTVIITDMNDCSIQIQDSISEPLEIILTEDITHVDCGGEFTGAIDLVITEGMPPYMVEWTGPNGFSSIDQSISGLEAGDYELTVLDDNSCEATASYEVLENPEITVTASLTDILCNSELTGAIDIMPLGGSPVYFFTWNGPDSFVSIDEDISDLQAGDYFLNITDSLGCQLDTMFTLVEPNALEISLDFDSLLCFNDSTAFIDITVSNGTLDYLYDWTGPLGFVSNDEDISTLGAGDYTLIVTDGNLCQLDTVVTIFTPEELLVTLDITPPSCNSDDGMVSAGVSGGTVDGDYTYEWYDSANDLIFAGNPITGLPAGSYTLIVRDDNSCEVSVPFELSSIVGSLVADITPVTCNGDMNGAIDLTGIDLAGTPTADWTGPNGYTSMDFDISDLGGGDYQVTVEDEDGCVLIETYTVPEPDEISYDADILSETCSGLDDGAINLTPLGGNGEYQFDWSGPSGFTAMTEDISGLEPGTYELMLSDSAGCGMSFSIEIESGIEVLIDGTVVNASCADSSDGAIDLEIIPVQAGMTFDWSGPGGFISDQEDLMGLIAGQYIVDITSEEFCTASDTFLVLQPDPILITLDILPATCGEENGEVSATAIGGTVNVDYSYEYVDLSDMSIISNTSTASGLGSGTYQLTVSDDNGCISIDQFTLSDDIGMIDAIVTDISCGGENDGSIITTITGVADPYQVSWTGPNGFTSDQEDIFDLAPGEYTISVIDANDCQIFESFEIEEGTELAITEDLVGVTCNGGSDGSIDITHLNGVPPFDYSWIGPNGFTSMDEDIFGLFAGTYELNFTDFEGCTGTATYLIDEPEPILAPGDITNNDCFGDSFGAIDIEVSGGEGPYDFFWTGPNGFSSIFEDIAGLEAGIYELTITDDRDCQETFQYEVVQPDEIGIDVIQLQEASCNGTDGLIEVLASNGLDPYFYAWTNSSGTNIGSDPLIDGLSAGSYTVTVTDGNDCVADSTIEVFNQEVTLTAIIDSVVCNGELNGAIDLTIIGNLNEPYEVEWDGPDPFTSDQEDISDLGPGVYSVLITDATDCVFGESFEVFEPDPLDATSIETDVLCAGDDNGEIQLTVVGGTPGYEFNWTGPNGFFSLDEDLIDLEAGVYDLVYTDAKDCSSTYSVEVDTPLPIDIIEDIEDPICVGIDNGTISLEISGGMEGYSFDWTGPQGFTSIQQNLVSLQPGTYTVIVTDENDCIAAETFELDGPQVIENQIEVFSATCFGDSDASVDISVSGGTPEFDYVWTGPGAFVSIDEDIMGVDAGQYVVSITDDSGCIRIDTVDVTQPELLNIADTTIIEPDCFGEATGAIDVTITGGTTDYGFSWSGPNGSSFDQEDINLVAAGSYVLEVVDANGCDTIATFEISQPDPIDVILEGSIDAQCGNSPDGAIDISVSGGQADYTYSWTGPNGFNSVDQDISSLFPGLYTITVTDMTLCDFQESFVISAVLDLTAEAGDYSAVCEGDLVTLNAGASMGANLFIWTDQQGDTIAEGVTATIPMNSGNNSFFLTTSDGLCTAIDSVIVPVLPLPSPDAGEDVTAFFEQIVQLGGDPVWTDAVDYDWEPDDLIQDGIPNPEYEVIQTQSFTVTVTDENGCQGIDVIMVTLIPDLQVPGGFSPNGDDANDFWVLDNSNRFPEMKVQVFNRWGDEIFESNGYPQPWDGKYEGVDVPVGTYYYIIELNDPMFPDPLTGPLTIFR